MENTPAIPGKPRTWNFHFTFSWDGPGLPDRAQVLEFAHSLNRRDLAIVGGALLFVFVLEPLLLFWLFSSSLKGQLQSYGTAMTTSLSGQIQSEVGPALKEALSQQQQRVITPLNASDPTALVLPSSTPPPPAPSAKNRR